MRLAHRDGIAQRRAADGIAGGDSGFERRDVRRERDIEAGTVGKIDDEDLVHGVRGADERERRGFDLRTAIAHAAAVVDDEPDGHGDVLAEEDGDPLRTAVLEDRERLPSEIRNRCAAPAPHGDVHHDEARLRVELEREGTQQDGDHGIFPSRAGASRTWIAVPAGNTTSRPRPTIAEYVVRTTPYAVTVTVIQCDIWLRATPSAPNPIMPPTALLPGTP